MHEWALAEAVIATVARLADEQGLREVTEVKITVGELQQVDQGVLKFALSQLKTPKFQRARFRIEKAQAKLKCRSCGHSWLFRKEKLDENAAEAIHFVPEIAHTYIKCPKCGSPDFEILRGRGVWLKSLKGVK